MVKLVAKRSDRSLNGMRSFILHAGNGCFCLNSSVDRI